MGREERAVVLGLGNILCGDDGFGVHAIQHLREGFAFPRRCQAIDGGTQGQLLYGIVEDADRLLIVDAADLGLAPGSLGCAEGADIPIWLGARKLSAHQGSFAEVLALAELKGILPKEIVLIGLQPETVEFGAPLSESARARLPEAERMILERLRAWGIEPEEAQSGVSDACREMFASFRGA